MQAVASIDNRRGHAARPPELDSRALDALRRTQLRPTLARVEILEVIADASPQSISSDGVFRELMLKGSSINIGTVYRTIQDLCQAALVEREPDTQFPVFYRLREAQPQGTDQIRLICRETGEVFVIDDDEIHERLTQAALRLGVDLRDQQLSIRFDNAVQKSQARQGRPPAKRPRLVK